CAKVPPAGGGIITACLDYW
nr:immunoglobulin heavy chain junction region [Macaca mulatta]